MDRVLELACEAGRIADAKKAENLVILDLREISTLTDSFVICSVSNARQARAIAQAIEAGLAPFDTRLDHIEGYPECTWVLMDYTDFIVHIFLKETREFYALEHLWGDAPKVKIDE